MWIFGQWFHFRVMMIQTLRGAFISIPKGGWEIAKFWINDFTIQQYLPTWKARKPNKNHRTTKKHRCGSFFFATHFFRGLWWLGGGFQYFSFSSLFWEDFQFDWYFSDGLVQPPTRWAMCIFPSMWPMVLLQSAAAVARDVGETLLCKARNVGKHCAGVGLGGRSRKRMGEMGEGLMKSWGKIK